MRAATHDRQLPILAVLITVMLALAPTLNAQLPKPLRNPYNAQLAGFVSDLQHASPPQASVLVRRIYDLRDYVDQPAEVFQAIARVAADTLRHPLVRDEAWQLLARIDVHENRLSAAREKLTDLGYVRQWAIAGPFVTAQGLGREFGPEQGFSPGAEYADGSLKRRWRVVPDLGQNAWVDLSDFCPQAGQAVTFAATSLFSDKPRTAALRFAADSAVALFVNGRQLFRDDAERAIAFDQYSVAVQLHAGWNSVLMKLYRSEPGPWRFGMRVTELGGGGVRLTASAMRTSTAAPAEGALRPPDDLVAIARRAADAEASAANLELLGRIEFDHSRGTWLEHFEAAARLQPTATRWLLVAHSCPDPACRIAALSAAVKTEPGDIAALIALADYYSGRQLLEKARDLLRDAVARAPGNFVAREHLAEVYASAGLNALAMQEYRRLQAEFPRPLWMRRELAFRYADYGLLNQAQTLLESVLSEEWDGSEERGLLAHIYERRHDAGHLRDAYLQAAQIHPTDTVVLTRLAQIAAGEGNLEAAQATMRAALVVAPENDELHRQYAELLVSAGQAEAAQQEFARALQINPQLTDVRRRLQWLGVNDADTDAQFLAEPTQLAAEARRPGFHVEASSVALADIRVEHVYDNGLSSVRVQQVFYVGNKQGARELARRSIQYTPDAQQLEILHARIHKPDGRTVEAEEDGEGAVAEPGVAMYYDVRARGLRFPGIGPGDVLELDYRISPATRTNPYGDYFGDLVIFGASEPEKLKRFVLITPEQRQFNVLEERMPAPASVSSRGGQRTFVWEARDLPALPNEPRSPAITEFAPYVNVSTFKSWEGLGRWYAQLVRPQFALDTTLRDALANLLAGTHSELDKIRAIHEFVLRNTHYVALEFGIYGYKPYPVSQTYARRFGDCKDKASLMIALLRGAGIDADIALVRTRRLGDIDANAASIAVFNHAVAYLPRYNLWLDGTAEYAGSRELPLEDQGAMALTVSEDGHAQLRRIPVTTAADNYTRRTVRAEIQPGGTIQFSGSAYARGEHAPGLRREYETAERQREAFRNHLAEIFPSVRLEDVQVDGADNLEHDVTVNFRGTLDTFAGRKLLSLTASWMPRAYLQTLAPLASRTQPLLLPAPWTTDEEIHIILPTTATVESMPASTVLDTQFGSATLRFERRGREVVIRTSVQFRKLNISTAEYAGFRDFCDQIERAFRGEVKVALQ